MAAEDAKISVFDRGFLFSDSVYEVIPFYAGAGFQLEEHITRLKTSLAALRINADIDFFEIVKNVVSKNGGGNRSVYLQVSRGAGVKRSHQIDSKMQPTIFACTNEIANNYLPELAHVVGIKVIVCEDLRWKRCDIKSTSLLPNILVIEQARQQNAQEALLMRDGCVLEGASSNLFIVENQKLVAPPSSHTILSGTTSQLVKTLAQENNIEIVHSNINYQRLVNADEVWISSSTRGVLPVVQVDDKIIADGQKGRVWAKLYQLLAQRQHALLTG
jgi:D-alanine transaminase